MKLAKISSVFILFGLLFTLDNNVSAIGELSVPTLVPVYRFWNIANKFSLYTASTTERDKFSLNTNLATEGIGWYAYNTQTDGTMPVYRLISTNYSYRFYTISEAQKNELLAKGGWIYDGIVFYAYATEQPNTVPVFRLSNIITHRNTFTTSPGEKNCFLDNYPSNTWTDKGTAFWVPQDGANVSLDETTCHPPFGPEISVGLWEYSKSESQDNPFKITANKNYRIKDRDGKIIADNIPASTPTKVKYESSGNLRVYNSIPTIVVDKQVTIEAADGNNIGLIVNMNRADSNFDHFRGKMRIRFCDTYSEIWAINILPLEEYVWGMGETTGTGPLEHTKVMTSVFRTYGYWYVKYATKYAVRGFKIRSDSGSQIYRGYDWESQYANIKKAAQSTQGRTVFYGGDVALTPYSSWTDGKTRRYEDGNWGGTCDKPTGTLSAIYPWMSSVSDPYGKNPTKSTCTLAKEGNHMVGLSANGSLKLAGSAYKKTWDWILKYYFRGIGLKAVY